MRPIQVGPLTAGRFWKIKLMIWLILYGRYNYFVARFVKISAKIYNKNIKYFIK